MGYLKRSSILGKQESKLSAWPKRQDRDKGSEDPRGGKFQRRTGEAEGLPVAMR